MRFLVLSILVVLAAAPCAAQKSTISTLTLHTLKPRERLALPWYRVAVGPDHPLTLAGRAEPVRFEQVGERLRMDGTGVEGFETEVVEGSVALVDLDATVGGGAPEQRSITFVAGSTTRGQSPWSVVVLDVLRGKIGRDAVSFVDHDADGTFFTRGQDMILRKKGGHLAPVSELLLLGRGLWRVTWDEPTRNVYSFAETGPEDPDVFPQWNEVVRGMEHINRIRSAMNLPPLGIARGSSRAALKHARYCALNGTFGHEESPDKPGYSTEGNRAGMDSLGSSQSSIPAAMDGFLSTLLHRMPLIDPRITEIGIGADGSQVWIEYQSGLRRPWDGQGPVIFPGPGARWKEGSFRGESPDPRPGGGAGGAVGLPVTAVWYGGEELEAFSAELWCGRQRLSAWRHDAEFQELLHMNYAHITLALMPKATLRHRPHLLKLRWQEGGQEFGWDYSFRIGR